MKNRLSFASAKRRAIRRSRLLKKRRLPRFLAISLALWLICYFGLPWLAPLPDELKQPAPASQIVLDRNGQVLRSFLRERSYRRQPVSFAELPEDLVACTLAAEDRRFWSHGGVDFAAALRAAKDNVASRRVVSGASTITQQLVKIASPRAERTLLVKLRESLQARRLEMSWSKRRILTEYLNRIDYGNGCSGCAAAARFYFAKPLRDLSLAECALLAGLPQAPSRLNPHRNHEAALKRRATVLQRLAKTDGRARAALTEALSLAKPLPPTKAAHAVRMLASETSAETRSTIDGPLQARLEGILAREIGRLREANVGNGAAVVIDNASGDVLALCGSSDFLDPNGGQINGAAARRSAGSTLKPFTYALALETGRVSAASVLPDVPTRFLGSTGLLDAVNFDRRYRGPVPLRDALANSLNVPALRLLGEHGGAAALLDRLRRLGMTTLDRGAEHYGLGLTIGNAEVKLLELTNAYACLARQGHFQPWRLILSETAPKAEAVFSEPVAWLIADILSDNAARAASFGVDSPLRLPFRCACKTGTSTDFRDNWCVGFTPEFTVGVWMGNFDGAPMRGISGAHGSAHVFHDVMLVLAETTQPTWFAEPKGLRRQVVDRRTGRVLAPGQSAPAAFMREEVFLANHVDAETSETKLDPEDRVLLDEATYGEWLRSAENSHRAIYAIATGEAAPLMHSPLPDATYVLDPELPNGGRFVKLESSLGPAAEWTSQTLRIDRQKGELELAPGRHEIALTDPRNGHTIRRWISVVER